MLWDSLGQRGGRDGEMLPELCRHGPGATDPTSARWGEAWLATDRALRTPGACPVTPRSKAFGHAVLGLWRQGL
eukprot:365226-Chlamydomonas_euryale.AAC.10